MIRSGNKLITAWQGAETADTLATGRSFLLMTL
jgi:hypothetical protein